MLERAEAERAVRVVSNHLHRACSCKLVFPCTRAALTAGSAVQNDDYFRVNDACNRLHRACSRERMPPYIGIPVLKGSHTTPDAVGFAVRSTELRGAVKNCSVARHVINRPFNQDFHFYLM